MEIFLASPKTGRIGFGPVPAPGVWAQQNFAIFDKFCRSVQSLYLYGQMRDERLIEKVRCARGLFTKTVRSPIY
jgi:hypothetical protein